MMVRHVTFAWEDDKQGETFLTTISQEIVRQTKLHERGIAPEERRARWASALAIQLRVNMESDTNGRGAAEEEMVDGQDAVVQPGGDGSRNAD